MPEDFEHYISIRKVTQDGEEFVDFHIQGDYKTLYSLVMCGMNDNEFFASLLIDACEDFKKNNVSNN